MKRVKANFDAEEAIEYMRSGGKLYLDGWTCWYNEQMILRDMSPVLIIDNDGEEAPSFSTINLWSNLDRAEIDEPLEATAQDDLRGLLKKLNTLEALASQDFDLSDVKGVIAKDGYISAQKAKNTEMREIVDSMQINHP